MTEAIACFERAIELRPYEALPRARLTEILLSERLFDDAEVQLARSLELEPGNVRLLHQHGWLAFERGEYAESRDWLARCVSTAPEWRAAHELLSRVHFRLGERELAAEANALAAALPPTEWGWGDPYVLAFGDLRRDPQILIEDGRLLLEAGEIEDARAVLDVVASRFPREASGYVELWRALAMSGEEAQASRVLDAGLRNVPGSSQLLHLRGLDQSREVVSSRVGAKPWARRIAFSFRSCVTQSGRQRSGG